MLNIAHRGFSSEFPENTILAFDEGMKAGADGFECDLRITADSKVVVFHDDDLKRLCGVKGTIEKLTWKEVQELKVKGKEKIPSLEEMLTTFHTTRINLELKYSERPASLVEEVLRVLTKVRPQGEILFSSFSPEILKVLTVMDPERKMGKLGLLVETENIDLLPESMTLLKPDTWNVPKQILRRSSVKGWLQATTPPLWMWTLDEPDEWLAASQMPLTVEAIITNKPKALGVFLKSPTGL